MPYIANPLEGLPIRNSFITDQSSLGAAPATDDTLVLYDLSGTELKQLTIANLFSAPAITGNATAVTQSAGNDSTRIATTAFVQAATGALNTISEMTDVTITSIASGELLKWNGSAWVNNTLAEAGIAPVATPTFTTSITIGSAVITEADLEQIDDLTAGTAVASKALVVDSNKDIGTIRNLTIDGVFTDGNYTFDTSGNVSGLGTIGSGNITSSGTVQGTTITATTAFVPDASDGAALGTASLEFSDLFLADEAVVSFGDDDDVTLTHVHNAGLLMSSSDKLQFGDAGTFVHQSADGVLTIESDTTVDINGAVVFDGALSGITTLTASGVVSAGGITLGNAVLVEAELEMLDGITAGTAAASKAVVLDSSTNITGIGTISAGAITSSGVVTGTGFTIGSAVINEAELETIDGITAGTAAASKALVLDASSNITGIGTIGSGAITSSGIVTGTGFTAGNAVLAEAELELLDGLTAGTAIASKVVTTDSNLDTTGQRNLTISGELDAVTGDFSGAVDIAGTLTLSGGDMDASDQNIANIKTATFVDEHDDGNSSTSDTIDWREGLKHKSTLTGNCTYTFTAPAGPCNLMFKVVQDGTGSRTVTWPNTVKWPASTAPTLTTTANGIDVIAFYYDGTNYYGQATLAFG